MPHSRQRLGRRAEELAARSLEQAGATIIARNARIHAAASGLVGEIDLIARHADQLVFVEVKAARAGREHGPERAVLAVDRRKQARLRRLAGAWLAANRPASRGTAMIRFDVIGVLYDSGGRLLDVDWIRTAF